MGENHNKTTDSLRIGLAIDHYQVYMIRARLLGVKSPEATEAYFQYKAERDVLSPEEQSIIDDQIVALERPDLAEEEELPSTREQVSSEHPDIVNLAKKVDDMQVMAAAEEIIKQANQDNKEE